MKFHFALRLPAFALATLSLCAVSACQGDASGEPEEGVESSVTVPAGVRDVLCGCVVEGVGRCGNYVVIDGEALELEGDLGLGKMEYCGKDGMQASVAGTVADGTFHATSYELVD